MKPIYLYKQENPDFNRVLELHKTDKLKARVLVKNDPGKYNYPEVILFNKEDSQDFSIISQLNTMRISINNKMYFYKDNKTIFTIKKDKFYVVIKKKKSSMIRSLTINYLNDRNNVIYEELVKRFSWMRFLMEEKEVFGNIAFTTIVKNKLYNKNDLLRFMYKTNLPVAKLLNEHNINYKDFKYMKRSLINIEAINPELLDSTGTWNNDNMLKDSIRMADILGKKINCAWSKKRLKAEHDKWSKEVTAIIMEASNRDLKISDIYKEFADFSKYNIINTTKELTMEGLDQSHCVATYISKVDNGSCAIYHINGYTAQILKNSDGLILYQFKGLRNIEAPTELRSSVISKIVEFNKTLEKKKEEVLENDLPY